MNVHGATRSFNASPLIGVGLYTPFEAGRLTRVPVKTIKRWLRGYIAGGTTYRPLWQPQVDLGDGVILGFRDLQEVRVAAAFIENGVSPLRLRQAIDVAKEFVADERPLSTNRFLSDGRSLFLHVLEQDGQTKPIKLFRKPLAFREIIARSLSDLDYDERGAPAMWWPLGRSKSVVLDPVRSFGQPIEARTSVPTSALASAARAEGSPEAAARAWDVPARAVRRAVAYEREMALRDAA